MPRHIVLIDFENLQPDSLELLVPEHFWVKVFVGANQARLPFELVAAMQKLGERAEYIKITGSGSNALDFHIAYYIGLMSAADPKACFHIVSKDTGFDPLIQYLTSRQVSVRRITAIDEIPVVKTAIKKASKEQKQIVADKPKKAKATPKKVATVKAPTVKAATAKVDTPKAPTKKVAAAKVATVKVATVKVATVKVATVKVATLKVAAKKVTKPVTLKSSGDSVDRDQFSATIPAEPKRANSQKSKTLDHFSEQIESIVKWLSRNKSAMPAKLKSLSNSIANFYQNKRSASEVSAVVEGLKQRGFISITDTKVRYRLPKPECEHTITQAMPIQDTQQPPRKRKTALFDDDEFA